ncbi:MAG: thiamine pyrophosphate-requiring protein, partial [Dehalococcoidia bacterium]
MTTPRSSNAEITVPVDHGAEALVEVLNSNGVEILFTNSGTDLFPIQEALAKFQSLGKSIPRSVVCPDEATAIAAAHGYFMVSGQPQVVLVHVDAGTIQLGGGMHNAQRGRAGVVVCAGRAPMTFEGEMIGSRSSSIHWIQEQADQGGMLRNFTKWDYELRRNENIQHVVQRAFQLATSEPYGPVYLTLPREVLMEPISEVKVLPHGRYGAVTTPQADPEGIARAAQMLLQAQSPLIVTSQSGRNPDMVDSMVQLAELVGAPVVTDSTRMNFPSTHPMYGGGSAQPFLDNADVILVVDHDVPYIPALGKPRPDAQIIQIDIDPIKPNIPLWVFPTDLLLHADSAKAVPALVTAIQESITEADRSRIEERYQLIKERREAQREQAIQQALSHADRSPITPVWLSYCIDQVLEEETLLLDESVTNSGNVANHVQRSQPGTLFKSGGSSLGWGLGAALGAKLAQPECTVVTTVGDGAFLFGCPTSTLWAADVNDAPFLTVIYNNQIHNAVKSSLRGGYPDGHSVREDRWLGMELSPSVEFAILAQACRAYGETVTES